MFFFRRKRILYIFVIYIVLCMLLAYHLYRIQLVQGDKLALQAMEEDTEKVVLEDIPRGGVLDCNLKSLTGGYFSYRIVIFPELIAEKHLVAKELTKVLGVETEIIMNYLNGVSCYLPYQLTTEQVQKVESYHFSGITVQLVHFRYGNHPLANHLIGHLGKIPSQEYLEHLNQQGNKKYHLSDTIGKIGLERYYEQDLKAKFSERSVRIPKDAYGNLVNSDKLILDENILNERRDLVLTIDKDIQREVEQIMDVQVKKGAIVVMDVATGEIVAMASRPNFDPRRVDEYLSANTEDVFLNRATALFQPGSVFKVLIAVAAIEENIVTKNTVFTCLGNQDKLVECWCYAGHGQINFLNAFAESCNPVFAHIGLRLGAEKIIEYARLLGLDCQNIVGYPIPIDKRQNFNLMAENYNLVNSSIGQGPVLVTPVQVTTLLNTIANNGIYIKPKIVKELCENGEIIKEFSSGSKVRVISEDTAREMQDLLKLVTTKGVGTKAYVPGYGSAGKTGSAQTGDLEGTVNAWFSGFAPFNNPKYTATVLVEDSVSGGESAAPIFKELMETILSLDK